MCFMAVAKAEKALIDGIVLTEQGKSNSSTQDRTKANSHNKLWMRKDKFNTFYNLGNVPFLVMVTYPMFAKSLTSK